MPKVVNIRESGIQPGIVRIDRKTKWGNPFIVGKDGTREEVIAMYEERLRLIPLIDDLHELRGMDLACWCSPLPCHGDVLLKLANQESE